MTSCEDASFFGLCRQKRKCVINNVTLIYGLTRRESKSNPNYFCKRRHNFKVTLAVKQQNEDFSHQTFESEGNKNIKTLIGNFSQACRPSLTSLYSCTFFFLIGDRYRTTTKGGTGHPPKWAGPPSDPQHQEHK